jgi:DNA-binding PadR family transcriptional regulator
MSLPNILLSLLREPMSGTDLIRLFNSSIKHFWKTDLSQIYRSLEALEREGCLRSRNLPSTRGPARRVYRLTAAGRRRLADWIRQPAQVPAAKFEYLAQLFSVTAVDRPRERAREILTSMRDEAARAVAALEMIDTLMRQAPGYPEAMPSFLFYPWLTLRHGLIRRRSLLEWIDEGLAILHRRPESADGDAGSETMSELVEALKLVAGETGNMEPPEHHGKKAAPEETKAGKKRAARRRVDGNRTDPMKANRNRADKKPIKKTEMAKRLKRPNRKQSA